MIHQWLAYILFGLAALHAAGALYHHFVRRDGVLMRILPGGTGESPATPPREYPAADGSR
jgi:cytochrome b561